MPWTCTNLVSASAPEVVQAAALPCLAASGVYCSTFCTKESEAPLNTVENFRGLKQLKFCAPESRCVCIVLPVYLHVRTSKLGSLCIVTNSRMPAKRRCAAPGHPAVCLLPDLKHSVALNRVLERDNPLPPACRPLRVVPSLNSVSVSNTGSDTVLCKLCC
jgi:hypothetical protein